MEDLEVALKKAEIDRIQSDTRRIDSETEKIKFEKEELSSKINSKWWHISGTSLIQAVLGGAVAGFLVAGFALDHFINVTDLNEKNEAALTKRADDLNTQTEKLQERIADLENETAQLQARVNNPVTQAEIPAGSKYKTDVWAYGVSPATVNKARNYLKGEGYGIGSGGLLRTKQSWLAATPAVFYYDESSKNIAEKIAAGLRDETDFEYDVQRGAGYGVAKDERPITFFIHIVPMN